MAQRQVAHVGSRHRRQHAAAVEAVLLHVLALKEDAREQRAHGDVQRLGVEHAAQGRRVEQALVVGAEPDASRAVVAESVDARGELCAVRQPQRVVAPALARAQVIFHIAVGQGDVGQPGRQYDQRVQNVADA